jgi:hypothetical protein
VKPRHLTVRCDGLPVRLADLNEARVSHLQAEMRKVKLAEATIKSNLAHLAAALGWAVKMKLIDRAPRNRVAEAGPRAEANEFLLWKALFLTLIDRGGVWLAARLNLVRQVGRGTRCGVSGWARGAWIGA